MVAKRSKGSMWMPGAAMGGCRRGLTRWLACMLVAGSASLSLAATVKQQPWGTTPAGEALVLFTIDEGPAELQVTNFGARIVAIRVPDRDGKVSDVVLTHDRPEGYVGGLGGVMGATIGRYANRIGGAQIEIDGVTSSLAKSNGPNTLHGGPAGFHTKVWTARPIANGVEMTLVSPDGDMGFPGEMTVHVSFRLTQEKGRTLVSLEYEASTTKPTVVNLTNHTFFNLSGNPETPVYSDLAMIAADSYTPGVAGLPTGTLDPVSGTAMDFRTPHAIGASIPDRGYDNNFVLRSSRITDISARVDDPASGRTLLMYTTEPGVQMFVPHASSQAPVAAAAGPTPPAPVQAFCLETQHFPDSPHHANFPSTTLYPGKVFRSKTIYAFTRTADLH